MANALTKRTASRARAISVVIPTLNEAKRLPLLLSDLAEQQVPPREIIVIDGGSSDNTVEIAKLHALVRVVKAKTPGVGSQRDEGWRIASSDWICFFDADVRVDPGFIKSVTHSIDRAHAQVLCPRYTPETQSLMTKALFGLLNWLFLVGSRHYPAGAGCCMIFKRKILEEIGGFNPTLLCDDLDCIYRAGKAGGYQQLTQSVRVSDRRFREAGFWRTAIQYAQISWFFITRQLQQSNRLQYPFGKHTL